MVVEDEEVAQLRSNAENLAKCLHALLERIEQLETKKAKNAPVMVAELPEVRKEKEETHGSYAEVVGGGKKNKRKKKGGATTSTNGGPAVTSSSPTSKTPPNSKTPPSDKKMAEKFVNGQESVVELVTSKPEPEKSEQVVTSDTVSVDPETGLKKRTIVTERMLTTKTFHALALDAAPLTPSGNARILSPVYQSRAVQVEARQLNQIEVEAIFGQLVVVKVNPDATHDIHPGDTITEVDGQPTSYPKDLSLLNGKVTLTLIPAAIYQAPSVFYRVNADYSSEADDNKVCRWLPIEVKAGDVIQVMSNDDKWMQARKVNDLSRVGYLPASLPMEKVSMLCPYGRRVLVLLGATGVGRRTIKSMLLKHCPQHFATVVPLTSRAPRPSEQEGREYHFARKEDMLQKIREGDMIEWGELDGQIYGTSAESVRTVVRSGRVCVLDCAPQALSYLYNGEFMPFVVHIVPPQLEEFLQLEGLRQTRRPIDQLSKTCAESDKISDGPHANQIHLTLTNRNMDVTFKRLIDALETLKSETQWVPESWMY